MTTPAIIFTGFEPFGGATYNPSWTVAEAAASATRATARLLPVTHAAVKEFARTRPASLAVIAVGRSGESAGVAIETTAYRDGGGVPDNDGVSRKRVDTRLGPPKLLVGALAKDLTSTLDERTPHNVFESEDAGRYICNALLYHLLEERGGGGPLAVFVHVPFMEPDAATELGVALGHAVAALFPTIDENSTQTRGCRAPGASGIGGGAG